MLHLVRFVSKKLTMERYEINKTKVKRFFHFSKTFFQSAVFKLESTYFNKTFFQKSLHFGKMPGETGKRRGVEPRPSPKNT